MSGTMIPNRICKRLSGCVYYPETREAFRRAMGQPDTIKMEVKQWYTATIKKLRNIQICGILWLQIEKIVFGFEPETKKQHYRAKP